jgi:hypothetical protein
VRKGLPARRKKPSRGRSQAHLDVSIPPGSHIQPDIPFEPLLSPLTESSSRAGVIATADGRCGNGSARSRAHRVFDSTYVPFHGPDCLCQFNDGFGDKLNLLVGGLIWAQRRLGERLRRRATQRCSPPYADTMHILLVGYYCLQVGGACGVLPLSSGFLRNVPCAGFAL